MQRYEYGYYIEIRKNDVPIPELQIETVHDGTVADKRTLNCCQKIILKNGDKLTAHLISRSNGDGLKGKYNVESTLSLERVPIF